MQSALPISALPQSKPAPKAADRAGEKPAEQSAFKDVFDAEGPSDITLPERDAEPVPADGAQGETDGSAQMPEVALPEVAAGEPDNLAGVDADDPGPDPAESEPPEPVVPVPSPALDAVAAASPDDAGDAIPAEDAKGASERAESEAKQVPARVPDGAVLPENASAAAFAAHDRAAGLDRQQDVPARARHGTADPHPAPAVPGQALPSVAKGKPGPDRSVVPAAEGLHRTDIRRQPEPVGFKMSHPNEPVRALRAASPEFASAMVSTPAGFSAQPSESVPPERLFPDLFPAAEIRGALRGDLPAIPSHPVTVDRAAPMQGIAAQLVEMVRIQDNGRAELRLHPEELGHIRLHFSPSETGHGLTVVIAADKPDTLDLVRRNIQDLAALLAEAGYESVAFDFGRSGERDPGSGQQRQTQPPIAPDVDSALQQRPTRPDVATSGIDIRL